ncbi:MAG: hypothetical protein CME31_08090 [Gimesia sp.]|uniref:Uncharacterized protein n=1 Tax=Gimesia maris TaxID=122 RepID=A0A3D3R5M0_9PLAN|nr:hypothetical protein [Gimesia sp.]HCO22920.1 hypothetical protein [Gimesia maris]
MILVLKLLLELIIRKQCFPLQKGFRAVVGLERNAVENRGKQQMHLHDKDGLQLPPLTCSLIRFTVRTDLNSRQDEFVTDFAELH